MTPVGGGWTSHKTRGDGDYEALKAAAIAQAQNNSYIQGVQSVFTGGLGEPIKDSRSKYGNVNILPQDLIQGANSNFAQKDVPGNMALDDAINQTGSQQLQTSATKVAQKDPQEFEMSALDKRLATMAKGGMNNLNDISSLYS